MILGLVSFQMLALDSAVTWVALSGLKQLWEILFKSLRCGADETARMQILFLG